jgi:Ala-tRNA(Pro) deacylase
MQIQALKDYLDRMGVKYITINHSLAYTSQQIVATTHIRGQELAKTVIVKLDGTMAMVVLPASFKVDLELVRRAAGADFAALAGEYEFQDLFADCEAGAMSPFGNLYGMVVYVEEKLIWDEEIAFNAGTHMKLIRMAYKDYARLVKPEVGRFTTNRVPAF